MHVRKQEYNLTLTDLMQFPIWEYALDEEGIEGQDEKTIRPYLESTTLYDRKAYLIVRTSFNLTDGTQFKGTIKPISLMEGGILKPLLPIDLRPIIITNQGYVGFWYGQSKPDSKVINHNYQILGKRPEEVFPIKFASDVEMINYITEGELEGFLYCDKDLRDFFNIKPTDIKIVK